ncbi:hypothetical protein TWF192_004565 [Orbilia oligospora]|nr:hypothetical protein TWF192_004565 [Orbilia oligospora]
MLAQGEKLVKGHLAILAERSEFFNLKAPDNCPWRPLKVDMTTFDYSSFYTVGLQKAESDFESIVELVDFDKWLQQNDFTSMLNKHPEATRAMLCSYGK